RLDPDEMAEPALKIAPTDERPVDPRRGHLQMISAIDRIVDIERGRNCAAHFLAILDAHRSVEPLRHDLQRQPILPRQANPHKAEAQGTQYRFDDRRNTRFHTRLADDALFAAVTIADFRHLASCVLLAGSTDGNKKERDRKDPL